MAALHLAVAGLRSRSKASLAALVLVVAMATVAVTAGLVVADSGARLVDRVAARANVADLVVNGSPAGLVEVADDPALGEVAGPYPLTGAELRGGGDEVHVIAVGTGSEVPTVGIPQVRSGRWLDGREQIVLEVSLADEMGIGTGDRVRLARAGRAVELTVVGTAIDLTDCLYPQCDPGRTFVDPSTVEELLGGDEPGGVLLVALPEGAVPERVAGELLRSSEGRIDGINTWPDTRGDLLAVDGVFSGFLTAFGVVVLIATGLVVAGSMTARMVARRREIGLVKAIGGSPGQVTVALLVEHLVLGAVGVVVGWLVGSLLAPSLRISLADTLGSTGVDLSVTALVTAAVLVGVLLVVCTVVPATRAGRLPAAEVLRDEQGLASGRLARAAGRMGGPPEVSLGVQDVAARPARSVIAALALAVGLAAVVVSTGFAASIGGAVQHPARAGDPWDVAVVPVTASPDEVEQALAAARSVRGWYAETDRRATRGDAEFLARAITGPPGGAGFTLGEGRMPDRVGEAVAGYGLLDLLGVRVGDDLAFEAGGHPLSVRIVGWYRDTEDSGEILLYPLEQLRTVEPDAQPDVWYATAAGGREATANELRVLLGERARVVPFDGGDDLTPFLVAIALIALIAVVVGLAHLVSTASVTAREQARTLGVLRAIGRTDRSLRVQAAVGGAAVGVLAAIVGIPLGLVTLQALSDAVTSGIGLGPGFTPTPGLLPLIVPTIVVVLVSALVSAAISHLLLRRSTTDLIRYE